MLADRVRMRSNSKNKEIEVTIHFSNFRQFDIFVGDGTLDQLDNPIYKNADTLVYSSNSDGTVTLMVEEGSYISVDYKSIYAFDFSFYYTSLDSTITSLNWPTYGGNIHVTENMDIYYGSLDDD